MALDKRPHSIGFFKVEKEIKRKLDIRGLRIKAAAANVDRNGKSPWRWISISTLVVDTGRRDVVLTHAETCDPNGMLVPLTSGLPLGDYLAAVSPQSILDLLDYIDELETSAAIP